jgi:uncharacterized OsmC-like protein
MSQATATERGPLNGVDVPTLFATIDVVNGARELAKFQFRATNRWESGTYSRTTIKSFFGAGEEHEHKREFAVEADHPEVLVAKDRAPLPVELVLAALASCLTGGIGTVAAARGIELYSVESTIEGEMDAQGVLGLEEGVRNGFQEIRIDFKIEGDAPPEKLEAIAMQSKARSAVYDIVTNQTPVQITVNGA